VNRAALELLGYAEEEIIGKAVGTIFQQEEQEEEDFFRGTGLARLVREGVARDVELTLLAKSGERIPVLFNGSVIREEHGRLAAVVGVPGMCGSASGRRRRCGNQRNVSNK